MTASQLATIIEQLILEADVRYGKSVIVFQNSLYNDLVLIIKDLDLTSDGYIRQSAYNRKILLQADRLIQEAFSFSSSYQSAVNKYVAVIPLIDAENIRYFTALNTEFKESRVFLKSVQKETLGAMTTYLLQDGLQSQVIQPLEHILTQNISTGGLYTGFAKQLEQYVRGDSEVEGRVLNYTRTYIRDSLFTYSRVYQQAVASDLKLEFYLYSGGLIDTSREFCEERAGKYFRKSEIESWASLEWKGKKRDTTETSIFHYAGGWNCSHQIIPVSEIVVPEEVKNPTR